MTDLADRLREGECGLEYAAADEIDALYDELCLARDGRARLQAALVELDACDFCADHERPKRIIREALSPTRTSGQDGK